MDPSAIVTIQLPKLYDSQSMRVIPNFTANKHHVNQLII